MNAYKIVNINDCGKDVSKDLIRASVRKKEEGLKSALFINSLDVISDMEYESLITWFKIRTTRTTKNS